MPNKRAPEKRVFKIWLTEELYAKLKRKAELADVPMSLLITMHILEITKNIKLTAEDYERIAKRIASRTHIRLK